MADVLFPSAYFTKSNDGTPDRVTVVGLGRRLKHKYFHHLAGEAVIDGDTYVLSLDSARRIKLGPTKPIISMFIGVFSVGAKQNADGTAAVRILTALATKGAAQLRVTISNGATAASNPATDDEFDIEVTAISYPSITGVPVVPGGAIADV